MPGSFSPMIREPTEAGTFFLSTTYWGDDGSFSSASMAGCVMPSGPASAAATCAALGLRDLHRIGVDQVGLHGHRQHPAVAAGDGAAHDRDRDRRGRQHLLLRQGPVARPVQALQLHQPAHEQGHDQPDAQQRGVQPAAVAGQAHARAARAGRRGRARRAARPGAPPGAEQGPGAAVRLPGPAFAALVALAAAPDADAARWPGRGGRCAPACGLRPSPYLRLSGRLPPSPGRRSERDPCGPRGPRGPPGGAGPRAGRRPDHSSWPPEPSPGVTGCIQVRRTRPRPGWAWCSCGRSAGRRSRASAASAGPAGTRASAIALAD